MKRTHTETREGRGEMAKMLRGIADRVDNGHKVSIVLSVVTTEDKKDDEGQFKVESWSLIGHDGATRGMLKLCMTELRRCADERKLTELFQIVFNVPDAAMLGGNENDEEEEDEERENESQ